MRNLFKNLAWITGKKREAAIPIYYMEEGGYKREISDPEKVSEAMATINRDHFAQDNGCQVS